VGSKEIAMHLAAIDIGTHAVRMDISESLKNGSVRKLATLQQTVSLGRDTFSKGFIENSTIKECIAALNHFRKVLAEYGITTEENVRCVATSAVREASNQEVFLDRIKTNTGFNVALLEEAQVNRYTFMAVEPLFGTGVLKSRSVTVIVEVGAGSTEVLLLHNGKVALSTSYRLGSLRIREMLHEHRNSVTHLHEFVESQIQRIAEQIKMNIKSNDSPLLVGLGGDLRFALRETKTKPSAIDKSVLFKVSDLRKLTKDVLLLSTEDLVSKYHLSYSDAETLAPALLVYLHLADALKTRRILTVTNSLRDGMIMEMSSSLPWRDELRKEILHSASEIGEKFSIDKKHAEKVAVVSVQLFRELAILHKLPPRYELLLHVAALLHDVGLFISNSEHHKHSAYIIEHSDLFGLGKEDVIIASQIARYHRRALPSVNHDVYAALSAEKRMAVSKLAALIRIADSLDRRREDGFRIAKISITENALVLKIKGVSDMTVEQITVKKKSDLFDKLFGLKVLLER
jgi:exopolyphosphatase/guanosine-5'-triphosphate,3'-diphosphate pyrophosphatase